MDKPIATPLPPVTEEVLRPTNIRTIFLGGIFIIALLFALHEASEIAIPIVLAFVLKLVLQPVFRFLTKYGLPRSLAAAIIVVSLVCGVVGLFTMLSAPAASWAGKIPESYPQLQQRLIFLSKPVQKTQKLIVEAEAITKGESTKVMPVAVVQGTRLTDKIFSGTQALASGFFTTFLVLFFLLAAGDTFLRRLVEVLPRFSDKRQAVDISQQIEQDVSVYLLTISTMNASIGMLTAITMKIFGIEDPLLWGSLAFLLNYIPIIGPLITSSILLLVGLLVMDDVWRAFLPATVYFIFHILEGSVITPMLLAKRFTLNPVLVILSLVFWYWMWGVPGAILAMPMLAITKIICDRIQSLSAFGHFLEG